MNSEIKSINLTRMRQAEAFSFHTLALEVMETCKESTFTDVRTAYKTSFDAFDKELLTSSLFCAIT